jgi:hypothetical protein
MAGTRYLFVEDNLNFDAEWFSYRLANTIWIESAELRHT